MTYRPVKHLPTEVARKIAAGEVIERPASILRELLDNAIDSGATSITADITDGGIECIRVTDNGNGMTKEDLLVAAHPHSTSKISTEEDLQNLTTLGFRGEALASIAAVSRLEITSIRPGEKNAWKMTAPLAGISSKGNNSSSDNEITPSLLAEGTVVQSESLFENIPARRLFLKRPSSEATQCKQTFIEKSLPVTNISFQFIVDGKTKLHLLKDQSLSERFVEALELSEPAELFSEITVKENDFNITLILGDPAISRTDKKYLYIYVNGRRIQEYSLVQAIEYGATGFFPNGTHPIAVAYININPKLIDFNIHPAKREVRFKDIGPVHHAISSAVRNFYVSKNQMLASEKYQLPQEDNLFQIEDEPISAHYSATHTVTAKNLAHDYSATDTVTAKNLSHDYSATDTVAAKNLSHEFSTTHTVTAKNLSHDYSPKSTPMAALAEVAATKNNTNSSFHPINFLSSNTNEQQYNFKYLGQLFNVFLLVEKNKSLFLVDQHAGHERILYNKIMTTAGQKQPLLVPYIIKTESDDDDKYIDSIKNELEKAGFEIKLAVKGVWEITTVPIKWNGTQSDLNDSIIKKRISPEEIIRTIAAYSACKAAIKEGHLLDSETAQKLISEIFELPEPRCPHGRPLWIELSQSELYELIKRT